MGSVARSMKAQAKPTPLEPQRGLGLFGVPWIYWGSSFVPEGGDIIVVEKKKVRRGTRSFARDQSSKYGFQTDRAMLIADAILED